MKYQIIIEIAADGIVKLESKGMKGPTCDQELDPIVENLGEVVEKKHTAEYYEKNNVTKNKTTVKTK